MALTSSQVIVDSEPANARESGMSLLLAGLMALLAAERLFALPLSMGPGLSLENALLYVVAGTLAFKIGVQRNFRFELRELHVCFVILLAYATLSIVAASLVVQYPGYGLIKSVISLKSRWVDQFVYFLVFFYGLQYSRSAYNVLKMVVLITVIANAIALLDTFGYIEAAGLEERDDGRIQGVMGESNQSAAFIASFLPALTAFALLAMGWRRLVWIAGLIVTSAAMIISASRGGFLAVIVSSIWGMVRFRRHVSARSVLSAVALAVLVLVVSLPFILAEYGWLLTNRIVGDTTSSDMVGASSGRLDIWANAFATMTKSPVTFLSGFGWNVYNTMPFRLAPHNHYVALWFDLGLVGLVCGAALLVIVARAAASAVPFATEKYRPVLIAFAIGTVAIGFATFFVDLYTPWLWFWAYAGLVMRIAVNTWAQARVQTTVATAPQTPQQPVRDPFGWVSTTR